MQTLRQQTSIDLDDLSIGFRLEAISVWYEFDIDAADCYALGA
ncbi:hypothetical protein [Zoogloea sp.]|nr:hypothetical protein [Zoogloea sp.]